MVCLEAKWGPWSPWTPKLVRASGRAFVTIQVRAARALAYPSPPRQTRVPAAAPIIATASLSIQEMFQAMTQNMAVLTMAVNAGTASCSKAEAAMLTIDTKINTFGTRFENYTSEVDAKFAALGAAPTATAAVPAKPGGWAQRGAGSTPPWTRSAGGALSFRSTSAAVAGAEPAASASALSPGFGRKVFAIGF